MNHAAKQSLVVLLAAALAACGGSSSSGSTTPGGGGNPGGGTPPTVTLSLEGTITAQGASSVTVNGVTVAATANTTTRIEHAERPESELKVGQHVRVKAHRNGTHEAEGIEIELEHDVQGKISSKDDAAGTITVAGQTVRVDDSTHFDDDSARLASASVQVGKRVKVSGVRDDKGGLRATRVEDDAGTSDDFQVKGVVSGSSAAGFTLTTVAGVTYTVSLGSGVTSPADGALVEVHAAGPAVGGAITATSITLEDRLPGLPDTETEVEGIVTAGTSDSFVVNGTTVTTSTSTTWNGGVPGDLLPGVKVEAEGTLGSDGVLSASKVTFKEYIRLEGVITGLSAPGATSATLTVNGVDVSGGPLTRWDDAATSLADGDWVEVRGSLSRDGTFVVASRVGLKSAGGNARPVLQGLVSAADATAGTVTILGMTLTAGAELRDQSTTSGVDGALLSRADFFAKVSAGFALVKATGSNNADWTAGASGVARSLELEGEK